MKQRTPVPPDDPPWLLLAKRIKLQHIELIHHVAHHLGDVNDLLVLSVEDGQGLHDDDVRFYTRYQAYLEHMLSELEEGIEP